MGERNTVVRSLHDLGLAAWFGGTLAGAVAVNGAAADVPDATQRLAVANVGWARWAPVNLAAVGAHLIGAVGLLAANRKRVVAQQGVGASSVVKTVLTVAALGATAYSGVLATKTQQGEGAPVEGGTDPAPTTPPGVAQAQRQYAVLQWVIPALTGSLVVVNAVQGEQQRPRQQFGGVVGRLIGSTD